jgi:DUF971 family protein
LEILIENKNDIKQESNLQILSKFTIKESNLLRVKFTDGSVVDLQSLYLRVQFPLNSITNMLKNKSLFKNISKYIITSKFLLTIGYIIKFLYLILV